MDAHSPLVVIFYRYSYSVLRRLNQPTRPTPMLPNRMALGAGMGCGETEV